MALFAKIALPVVLFALLELGRNDDSKAGMDAPSLVRSARMERLARC